MNAHKHLDRGAPADVGAYAVHKRLGGLARHLPRQCDRWLDVGCGNGAYTIAIASLAKCVVGVDLNAKHLRELRVLVSARPGSHTWPAKAHAERLPFADETFDVVSLIEVLEHVDSEQETLHECHRVLRPGGCLAITVPNKWYPFEIHGACIGPMFLGGRVPFISWLPDPIHRRIARARIYTARRIRTLVMGAGFRLLATDYVFPPLDRIALPEGIKQVYRRLASALERTFLRCLGVSILLVARKQ